MHIKIKATNKNLRASSFKCLKFLYVMLNARPLIRYLGSFTMSSACPKYMCGTICEVKYKFALSHGCLLGRIFEENHSDTVIAFCKCIISCYEVVVKKFTQVWSGSFTLFFINNAFPKSYFSYKKKSPIEKKRLKAESNTHSEKNTISWYIKRPTLNGTKVNNKTSMNYKHNPNTVTMENQKCPFHERLKRSDFFYKELLIWMRFYKTSPAELILPCLLHYNHMKLLLIDSIL